MPVFREDTVEWLRARSNPPTPPPAFEQPAERPLFAPEPPEGAPSRRTPPARQREHDDYWPWDSSPGVAGTGTGALTPVPEVMPGRRWLHLAWVVGISALLLMLIAAAYQFGLNGSGGRDGTDDGATPSATPTVSSGPLTGLTAVDLDPEGDPPAEYPENVPLAVDDDLGTVWGTQTYEQQFGPKGYKTGVGLVVDLGQVVGVRQVQVSVVGGETAAQVFVTDNAPARVDDLEPAGATASEDVLTFTFDEPLQGRFVTIWLTKVPQVDGGFRGQIAEVEVFA